MTTDQSSTQNPWMRGVMPGANRALALKVAAELADDERWERARSRTMAGESPVAGVVREVTIMARAFEEFLGGASIDGVIRKANTLDEATGLGVEPEPDILAFGMRTGHIALIGRILRDITAVEPWRYCGGGPEICPYCSGDEDRGHDGSCAIDLAKGIVDNFWPGSG